MAQQCFPVTCLILSALNPAGFLSKNAPSVAVCSKTKKYNFQSAKLLLFLKHVLQKIKNLERKKGLGGDFKDPTMVVRFKMYVFPESCLILLRSVRRAKCLEETLCLAGKWSNSPTCRQNGDSYKDKKK